MAVSIEPKLSTAYELFLDFLIEKATPQEILAFQLPEKEQQRAIELLEKNNAGTLTPQEVADLEQMSQLNLFVSMLRAKALEALQNS